MEVSCKVSKERLISLICSKSSIFLKNDNVLEESTKSYGKKSERSTQEGDWPIVAFSPRKQNLTLYVMPSLAINKSLYAKLGKHKTSVGCLYINSLADVDESVLERIVKAAYLHFDKLHNKKKAKK